MNLKRGQFGQISRGNQKLIVTEIIVVGVMSLFALIISINKSQKFSLIDSKANENMRRKLLEKKRRSLLLNLLFYLCHLNLRS